MRTEHRLQLAFYQRMVGVLFRGVDGETAAQLSSDEQTARKQQQGVSLNFGVRAGSTPGVRRADLWGTQNEKYDWCENTKFQNAKWQEVVLMLPHSKLSWIVSLTSLLLADREF